MFVKFKIMIMLSLFFRTQPLLAIQTTLIFTTNVQLFHSLQSIRKYFFQDQLIRGFVNNNLEMFVGDLRGS